MFFNRLISLQDGQRMKNLQICIPVESRDESIVLKFNLCNSVAFVLIHASSCIALIHIAMHHCYYPYGCALFLSTSSRIFLIHIVTPDMVSMNWRKIGAILPKPLWQHRKFFYPLWRSSSSWEKHKQRKPVSTVLLKIDDSVSRIRSIEKAHQTHLDRESDWVRLSSICMLPYKLERADFYTNI